MKKERKSFPVKVLSASDEGIVEAIVAVMGNIDGGDDIIHPGAFRKTLAERGGEVLVLDAHRTDTVLAAVGVPLEIRELGQDELPADLRQKYPEATGGLYTKTRYLMDTPEGAGVFQRIRSGAVRQYSIGYDPIKGGTDYSKVSVGGREKTVRNLRELRLYEYSPVLFAMNEATATVGVKAVTPFQDLPLAARDREWDAAAAEARVRAWAGGDELDWEQYARAFLWHNAEEPEMFGSYKLGYADVVDEELMAIPRAIFAAAGGRGVDAAGIPDADKERVKEQITRYYEKMAAAFDDETLISPFAKASKEMTPHGPVRRLLDVFTGTIHYGYTTMADRWLIEGFISRDERMEIGRLTGEALKVLTEGMPADLANREVGYSGYGLMAAAAHERKEASLSGMIDRIRGAFNLQFNTNDDWRYWIHEIFADYVIACAGMDTGNPYYRVSYHENENGDLIFAPVAEWVGGAMVFMPDSMGEGKAGRVMAQRNVERIMAAMQMLREALADAGILQDDGSDEDEEDDDMKSHAPPDTKGAARTTAAGGAGPETPPTQTYLRQQLALEMLDLELLQVEV